MTISLAFHAVTRLCLPHFPRPITQRIATLIESFNYMPDRTHVYRDYTGKERTGDRGLDTYIDSIYMDNLF